MALHKFWIIAAAAGIALLGHDAHGKKNAPPAAAKLKSPLLAAQAKPDLGRGFYEQSCASCHGATGQPAAKLTPKPTNLTDHHMDSMKDGEIYWVITNGIGKQMPAFKDNLSDVERWQIVAYVRSLRKPAK